MVLPGVEHMKHLNMVYPNGTNFAPFGRLDVWVLEN